MKSAVPASPQVCRITSRYCMSSDAFTKASILINEDCCPSLTVQNHFKVQVVILGQHPGRCRVLSQPHFNRTESFVWMTSGILHLHDLWMAKLTSAVQNHFKVQYCRSDTLLWAKLTPVIQNPFEVHRSTELHQAYGVRIRWVMEGKTHLGSAESLQGTTGLLHGILFLLWHTFVDKTHLGSAESLQSMYKVQ
jgi:hypothetical protein